MKQKTNKLAQFKQWILSIVRLSFLREDKKEPIIEGSCRCCKFNNEPYCTVGTYYAETAMKNRVCYCGELWEANEA